jgi:hypothetical protein
MNNSQLITKGLFATVVAGALLLAGCAKEENKNSFFGSNSNMTASTSATIAHFNVSLESNNVQNADGNFEWVWKVEQTQFNEGGRNGVRRNGISHFNMSNFACLQAEDLVSLSWSTDGINWSTPVSASFAPDNSTSACGTDDVLKFDYGTGAVNYYKLVINKEYATASVPAIIKAGNSCFTGEVMSIGCEEDEEFCWNDETAWSAGDRYVSQGNWATYTAYDGTAKTVTLFAGQTINIGTVTFSNEVNGQVTISINLNSDIAKYAVDNEALKIQAYDVAPTGNPSPGLFTTSKSNSTSVTVPSANYFGVHLDALVKGECKD